MRVVVDTQEMCRMLARLSYALDGKSDLESFRVLRVDVTGGKLRFTGTMPTVFASDIYEKDEKRRSVIDPFGVDGKEFFDAIRVLGVRKKQCTVVIDKTNISIESGRTKLKMQKYSEDMLLPSGEDFPEDGFRELDVQGFCRSLKRTSTVPDGDPNRDIHSATIHINQEHIVATNRKILSIQENKYIKCGIVPFQMTNSSAQRLIKMFSSLDGNCEYLIDGHFLYIRKGSFRAKIVGSVMVYPRYKNIIMTMNSRHSVKVDRIDFVTALRAAEIALTKEKNSKTIKISFEKDGAHLECNSAESSFSDVVKYTSKPLSREESHELKEAGPILFDLGLLSKGISSLEELEVSIDIDSKERPLRFSEGEYEFYINPLRFA